MPVNDFSHAKTGNFSIQPPHLYNPYRDDPLIDKTLQRLLPPQEYERTSKDLDRFAGRILSEITNLGRQCELKKPELITQDAWGRRVDELRVCDEWYKLKKIMAEEGLVAIGYDESRDPVHRRIHQTVKLLLYSPSSGLTSCPLAMTDGAVRTFRALGIHKTNPEIAKAYERLISTDGERAWTSGQWMTEKRGGSDVSGACDTYAVHEEGDTYRLYGYKWFSSAIDADIALTLARIADKTGNSNEPLSLFFLHVRDEVSGDLNGIQMIRLKDKLGTRQLPTAELLLDGVKATLIGEPGRGVASISNMLNVTRLHNSAGSVSAMRRILNLARDYATRREAFGRKLVEWPLHIRTMAALEVDVRACTLFLLDVARLIGLSESGRSTEEEADLIRLLTPVIKAYTAKICMPYVSEALECFGGMGYMEDSGIASALRDAQVMPIWEGTTNVLSMDVIRVMATRPNAMQAFHSTVLKLLEEPLTRRDQRILASARAVADANANIQNNIRTFSDLSNIEEGIRFSGGARSILMALGRVYCGYYHSAAVLATIPSIETTTRMKIATWSFSESQSGKSSSDRYASYAKTIMRAFMAKRKDIDTHERMFEALTSGKGLRGMSVHLATVGFTPQSKTKLNGISGLGHFEFNGDTLSAWRFRGIREGMKVKGLKGIDSSIIWNSHGGKLWSYGLKEEEEKKIADGEEPHYHHLLL